MASEVRVNQIQNRSGLGTITVADTGQVLSGVTTVGILSTTSNIVVEGTMSLSGGLPFYSNSQTVTSNYTVGGSTNSMSAGAITINSGITVTISSGGVWTIV